jgi:uncharacterized membrane protein
VLDEALLALHVLAVVIYLGGGILFHGPLRRALKLIPPGQASIIGAKIGNDFTYLSWLSLALWGVTGYWMLFRFGWADGSSPLTLFVNPTFLNTRAGLSMLIMLITWYLIVINASLISFTYRPKLALRVDAGAGAEDAERVAEVIGKAADRIDVLALANLVLTFIGLLSGAVFL